MRPRRLPAPMRALLAVGGGGLLSVTLSACYGGPCAGGSCYEPEDSGTPNCTDFSQDLDGDGYCLDRDCDEANANVHEGCAADGGMTDAGSGGDAGTTEDAGPSTDDGGLSTDAGLTTDAGADASP